MAAAGKLNILSAVVVSASFPGNGSSATSPSIGHYNMVISHEEQPLILLLSSSKRKEKRLARTWEIGLTGVVALKFVN